MPVDSPEDLYGLPLERFVEERTALVKALRARKETEEAKRVGALRKPTVGAWAVNQLVRTQAKGMKALFQAGDDLAAALGAGAGGAEAIRAATRRQRDALAELMGAAEGLLTGEGRELGAATLERVSETLRAAAIDPQAREQVSRGCLEKELQAAGWLAPGAAAAPPAARGGGGDARSAREVERAQQAARKEAEAAVRELDAARRGREAAEAEVEDARAALATAQAALNKAEAALLKAEAQLSEADQALAAAEARAEAAASALDKTRE